MKVCCWSVAPVRPTTASRRRLGFPPDPSPRPVMFPGPVFNLELRRLSRRKRYYALLTIYGLALFFLVWSNDPQAMFVLPKGQAGGLSIDQWHYAGKELFQAFAI